MARARHRDGAARGEGRGRDVGRRRADRLRLRPHGNRARPRRRSSPRSRASSASTWLRAATVGTHPAYVEHGPRARRRAAHAERAAARARLARPEPRPLRSPIAACPGGPDRRSRRCAASTIRTSTPRVKADGRDRPRCRSSSARASPGLARGADARSRGPRTCSCSRRSSEWAAESTRCASSAAARKPAAPTSAPATRA